MMRIGVFGGTFDPPHIGHLILASEAAAQLGLAQVRWLLTPNPPHKQGQDVSPLEVRLELLQAALAGNNQFVLLRTDIDRPPPHYAADTLALLHATEPQVEWVYVMGGDSLRDLPRWYEPLRLLKSCQALGVLRRPGAQIDLAALEASLPGLSEKVQWIDAPRLEISSSRIRQMVQSGGPYRYYLLPSVYRLIQERNLYR